MHVDDLILVSIDDHVVEPPDMFDSHVPGQVQGPRRPIVVTDDKGVEQWMFQGRPQGVDAASTPWCRGPKEEWGCDPAGFAEMRPGVVRRPRARPRHEPQRHPRVDVLPDVRRLLGAAPPACTDKDLTLVMVSGLQRLAHRRVGAALSRTASSRSRSLPTWDPEAMVAEIRRVAAKGCRAITMPELPHLEGLPSYHDVDYWGPVFRALSEEQRRDVPAHRHRASARSAWRPTRRSTT